jgi:hypothetical protein
LDAPQQIKQRRRRKQPGWMSKRWHIGMPTGISLRQRLSWNVKLQKHEIGKLE